MKVKGWVVVDKTTKRIHHFRYNKISAINKAKELGTYSLTLYIVKPCVITINDKAVKG